MLRTEHPPFSYLREYSLDIILGLCFASVLKRSTVMKNVIFGLAITAALAVAPAAMARQADTLIGDARRQSGLEAEMARLRQTSPGSARDGVCPLVRGASAEVNAYVAARLHQVARQAGATYAKRACEPNVVVLFSAEPDQLIREAAQSKRFNYRGAPADAVQAFKAGGQPVRWVHGGDVRGSAAGDARPHNALVVVDAAMAQNVKVSALADYLAMVSLADVRVRPAPANSIMSLFDTSGASPAALTPADQAYLRSVYRAR
ncbi:hypothetical protein EIB18_07860 [Caulobacter vibrioides]|nr:hypothetical protein CA608_08130 [Caulobacter vibrioides]AZH12637.1 hypothetical protein EIB18_07860 [Caulobacter vibrioides]PLR15073.1 hypothetical protein CVUC_03725 [Caulobacter vibrioides]